MLRCKVQTHELYNGSAAERIALFCGGMPCHSVRLAGKRGREVRVPLPVRSAASPNVVPVFGGYVVVRVKNADGIPCKVACGTFAVQLDALQQRWANDRATAAHGSTQIAVPVVNYALREQLMHEHASARKAIDSATMGEVVMDIDFETPMFDDPTAPASFAARQYSQRVFEDYVRPWYDVCVADGSMRPTQHKLYECHVPYFVTATGVALPASAYLQWHQRDLSERDTMRQLRHSVRAAVACYPELRSVEDYLDALNELTRSRDYAARLGVRHRAALRASFEVLTQLSCAAPYVEDFAFTRTRTGRRRIEDDFYCPASITEGTDCEDGAKLACEIKRAIERNAGSMGEFGDLATLYSFFVECVAVTYCADREPQQSERYQGMCHIVCMLIPKVSAQHMMSGAHRETATPHTAIFRDDHWIRRVSLVVPETTSLTDAQLYPPCTSTPIERRHEWIAKMSVAESAPTDEAAVMAHDTFVYPRTVGGERRGYMPSAFYQWITNVWLARDDDDNDNAWDLLPVYTPKGGGGGGETTWGVRVGDISAQSLMLMRAYERGELVDVFGDDVVERLESADVRFVPRVTNCYPQCYALMRDILRHHEPDYPIVPAQDGGRRNKSSVDVFIKALNTPGHEHLSEAFNASVDVSALQHYVRMDFYAADLLQHTGTSTSDSLYKILCQLDTQFAPHRPFYAARVVTNDIFRGCFPNKITLLLFYRPQSFIERSGDMSQFRHAPSLSLRGNFTS